MKDVTKIKQLWSRYSNDLKDPKANMRDGESEVVTDVLTAGLLSVADKIRLLIAPHLDEMNETDMHKNSETWWRLVSQLLPSCWKHLFTYLLYDQTLSAPVRRTRMRKTNNTVSQTLPITVEWVWTLSSRRPSTSHSPISVATCPAFYMGRYMRWLIIMTLRRLTFIIDGFKMNYLEAILFYSFS